MIQIKKNTKLSISKLLLIESNSTELLISFHKISFQIDKL
jgi:hypothetical protein